MPARKPLQAPLFPVKPKAKLRTHAGQNLEAATIILTDPLKYGGEGSLMVLWARVVTGIAELRCIRRGAGSPEHPSRSVEGSRESGVGRLEARG